MTKGKARQRAKAKADQKAKKRKAAQPEQKVRPGQFDPGPGTIKGPGASPNTKNFGGAKRGAARSR